MRTYSTDEAAHLLSVSGSYFRKLIDRGDIEATKSGRSWRVPDTEVERLRAERSTALETSGTVAQPDAQPVTQVARLGAQLDAQPMAQVAQPDAQLERELRDLRARVAHVENDKVLLREELGITRNEASHREEAWKVRVIDLERAATARESRISDLNEQVSVLEAKVREVLEKGQDNAVRLADRIADLVVVQQEMQTRVIELQPVAAQVPMLQAAVEEKDASLSERESVLHERERELGNMRQDIEAIASRPVTGPVFRLLTKGKLRR